MQQSSDHFGYSWTGQTWSYASTRGKRWWSKNSKFSKKFRDFWSSCKQHAYGISGMVVIGVIACAGLKSRSNRAHSLRGGGCGGTEGASALLANSDDVPLSLAGLHTEVQSTPSAAKVRVEDLTREDLTEMKKSMVEGYRALLKAKLEGSELELLVWWAPLVRLMLGECGKLVWELVDLAHRLDKTLDAAIRNRLPVVLPEANEYDYSHIETCFCGEEESRQIHKLYNAVSLMAHPAFSGVLNSHLAKMPQDIQVEIRELLRLGR